MYQIGIFESVEAPEPMWRGCVEDCRALSPRDIVFQGAIKELLDGADHTIVRRGFGPAFLVLRLVEVD